MDNNFVQFINNNLKTIRRQRKTSRTFRLSDETISLIGNAMTKNHYQSQTDLVEDAIQNFCIFLNRPGQTLQPTEQTNDQRHD